MAIACIPLHRYSLTFAYHDFIHAVTNVKNVKNIPIIRFM